MAVDAYVQFNGVELLNDNSIINFRVDEYQIDPTITKPGRMWYNTAQDAWKYSSTKNGVLEIKYMDKALNPTGEVLPLGWKSINGYVTFNAANNESPIWIILDNGLGYFSFPDTKIKSTFINFNLPYDVKVGSKIYPTLHWAPASISTGNVTWELSYTVTRGYGQQDVINKLGTSMIINTNSKGIAYEQQTTFCSDLQAILISEPNATISFKLSRLGGAVADTYIGDALVISLALTYQSDHESTLNKSPNFNIA